MQSFDKILSSELHVQCLQDQSELRKDPDFRELSVKEVSYLLANYAEKHSLPLTECAFTIDGEELVRLSTEPTGMSYALFGKKVDCNDLVDKIRQSRKYQYSSLDFEYLEKAFSAQYNDPNNLVGDFVSYIRECFIAYRSPVQFLAPCIALVQCSGSGKTRLLRETARQLPVLYICLRQGNSGFPNRTDAAYSALFCSLDVSRGEAHCQNDLVERLRLAEISARQNLPGPNTVCKGYSLSDALFPSEQFRNLVWDLSAINTNKPPQWDAQEPILLVLDEARELLEESEPRLIFGVNKFRFLLRALKQYWAAYPQALLFTVMVDTSSRITKFAPPSSKWLPSARQMKDLVGGSLLHPYILRRSFDAIFHEHKLPEGTRDITPLLSNKDYLLAGRPLVALQDPNKGRKLEFLLYKLYGGTKMSKKSLGPLSTVLCRLATSISCHSSEGVDLVAEHMIHLLAADLERELMFVSHLAEPRLAQAASLAWMNEDLLLQMMLPSLQQALISGLVSVRARGEIVAQIILLKAFDAACVNAGKSCGEYVPLMSVLKELLPVENDIDIEAAVPVALRSASVACGQFVQLAHNFCLNTIVRLAERHCGASFKSMQPSVDLFFPIVSDVSAVALIQVKVHENEDRESRESLRRCSAMLPSVAFSNQKCSTSDLENLDKNCVRIYMQLGSRANHAICRENDNPQVSASALQIFGLSSRCLSQAVRKSLRVLLGASCNLESFENEKAASAEGVYPIQVDVPKLRKYFPFIIDADPGQKLTWIQMKRDELKCICKIRNLNFNDKGDKAELVQTLIKADITLSEKEFGYVDMTVAALRDLLKKNGIYGVSKMLKWQLIQKVIEEKL